MANEILYKEGTGIVLADATDYPGVAAANSLGTRTHQLDLTSLGAGAARQSAKFDFGVGGDVWARLFYIRAAIEIDTPPIAEETIDFYLGFSHSLTPANANPGGLSGVDGAYTGYPAGLEPSLKLLDFMGSLVMTVDDTGTVQIATIRTFIPIDRYGSLVVVNRSAGDILQADATEMSVRIAPITEQLQL